MGAFGFGSFVFSYLAQFMCNPDNEMPTIQTADGSKFYSKNVAETFPRFFGVMAACWALLAFIALLLVRKNPDLQAQNSSDHRNMLTATEGVQTSQFWKLFAMDVSSIFAFMYMSSVYKTMAI